MFHSVKSEHSDTDESEAAVEFLTGEGVPAVQGESEEDDEEYEGRDPDDDLCDGEDPDESERIPVGSHASRDVETAGLVTQRSTSHAAHI